MPEWIPIHCGHINACSYSDSSRGISSNLWVFWCDLINPTVGSFRIWHGKVKEWVDGWVFGWMEVKNQGNFTGRWRKLLQFFPRHGVVLFCCSSFVVCCLLRFYFNMIFPAIVIVCSLLFASVFLPCSPHLSLYLCKFPFLSSPRQPLKKLSVFLGWQHMEQPSPSYWDWDWDWELLGLGHENLATWWWKGGGRPSASCLAVFVL